MGRDWRDIIWTREKEEEKEVVKKGGLLACLLGGRVGSDKVIAVMRGVQRASPLRWDNQVPDDGLGRGSVVQWLPAEQRRKRDETGTHWE